jgi:hypothetical protein
MNERHGVEVVRPAKAGPGASGGGSARMRVKNWTDYPDSIVCKQWDGENEGDTEIHVAKPYELRRTPFETGTHDGYTYSYSGNLQRTSTRVSDGHEELQTIAPDYYLNQEIKAVRGITGDTGVEVAGVGKLEWEENPGGRSWAYTEE